MPTIKTHSTLALIASCLLFVSCNTKSNKGNQGMIDQLIENFTADEKSMKYIIDNWILGDKKLSALLKAIKDSSKNEQEEALAIFHQVPAMYQIPKVYEDLTEQVYEEYEKLDIEPHTVFQELAIIKYLFPKATIKNNVLLAIYMVLNKEQVDLLLVANKNYGSEEKIPKPSAIYFFGKDIDARITFSIPPGLPTWTASGAVEMWKIF